MELAELIMYQFKEHSDSQEIQLMCARGLLMLMCNPHFGDFDWFKVSLEIMEGFTSVFKNSTSESKRAIHEVEQHDLIVQFLASFDMEQLHEYVMQIQSLLTLNIITGYMDMEVLTHCIRTLDILHWVNSALRDQADQIAQKEFHNDAVNNNLDLKS